MECISVYEKKMDLLLSGFLCIFHSYYRINVIIQYYYGQLKSSSKQKKNILEMKYCLDIRPRIQYCVNSDDDFNDIELENQHRFALQYPILIKYRIMHFENYKLEKRPTIVEMCKYCKNYIPLFFLQTFDGYSLIKDIKSAFDNSNNCVFFECMDNGKDIIKYKKYPQFCSCEENKTYIWNCHVQKKMYNLYPKSRNPEKME